MKLQILVACLSAVVRAELESEDDFLAGVTLENPQVDLTDFVKTTVTAPFLEQFTNGLKRWIPSSAKKFIDGVEDPNLLQFRGEWKVEAPVEELIKGDQGLVLKTLAAHSAISAKFPKVIDPKGKKLVVQYEVKAQNGMECGGAYMKLLSQDSKFTPEQFSDKTPYTIMFGPDKCGANNKVHFIFRHMNPITKKFEEKHLVNPPSVPSGTQTNLYTLIVNPDQTYVIKINNESVSNGSLLENFTPSVNPPETIPDPKETEPADWVNEAEIPDPKAKKPADWDEDAPEQIVDESAKMPEDWLVDEPAYIADPEVKMPEDWDEEEDGDWTAPTIPNPKCADVSGCGPWSKPLIKNPAYKGKWSAPMIANPLYKGVWKPKMIKNPDYFKDDRPSDFTPMGAVGFELWSMQDGFIFDNIYIGHSAEDAATLAEESWILKKIVEDSKIITEKDPEVKPAAEGFAAKVKAIIEESMQKVLAFFEIAKVDPVGAIKQKPQVAVTLLSILLAPLLFLSVLAGSKKTAAVESKTPKKETKAKASDAIPKDEETEKKTKKTSKGSPKKD